MIDNETFLLPKNYLSWSAMEIWEKSPERYAREYFTSGRKLDTDALRFGKFIASSIERVLELEKEGKVLATASASTEGSVLREYIITTLMSELNMNRLTAETLVKLEKGDVAEYKMFTEIKGVQCLSFIDSYDTTTGCFREYKTGKVPWSQAKVQKHGQLLFYATMLHALTGKMPPHCHLDWIETENVERVEEEGLHNEQPRLRLTGRITTYKREFDSREMYAMEQRILKAAREISVAYEKFIKDLDI